MGKYTVEKTEMYIMIYSKTELLYNGVLLIYESGKISIMYKLEARRL